jgi:hypothetical protein
MRKKILFSLFVGLALLFCSSMVKASDTSPYLIGNWEFAVACNAPTGLGSIWYTLVTDFSIVNPVPAPVFVYAAFFSNNGLYLRCFKYTFPANGEWNLRLSSLPPDQIQWLYSMNSCQPGSAPLSESRGTVKFFAFPVPTPPETIPRTFNASMVIGGFQQKWMIPSARIFSRSEAGLNAVVLNSITSWEFTNILNLQKSAETECLPWE